MWEANSLVSAPSVTREFLYPAPSTSYRTVDRELEAPLAIVWEAGEPHKSCPGEQGSTLHIRPLSAAKRKDWEGSPVPEINLVPLLPKMELGIQSPGMMFVKKLATFPPLEYTHSYKDKYHFPYIRSKT